MLDSCIADPTASDSQTGPAHDSELPHGRGLTQTLGTGPGFSLSDVRINGLFWNSVDNYAPTNGDKAIALSLTQVARSD